MAIRRRGIEVRKEEPWMPETGEGEGRQWDVDVTRAENYRAKKGNKEL